MLSIVGVSAVFASAILIAVADALIKKMGTSSAFFTAVFSPWMLLVCILYFVQILLALYVFIHKGELAIYANIFIVFYSILMVGLGIAAFREQLSFVQGVGITLALTGAVLLNSGW